jgi:hypothetical protein
MVTGNEITIIIRTDEWSKCSAGKSQCRRSDQGEGNVISGSFGWNCLSAHLLVSAVSLSDKESGQNRLL